jgi:hypothetical protein
MATLKLVLPVFLTVKLEALNKHSSPSQDHFCFSLDITNKLLIPLNRIILKGIFLFQGLCPFKEFVTLLSRAILKALKIK